MNTQVATNYDVIRRLAERNRPLTPATVIRRLALMALVMAIAAAVSGALVVLAVQGAVQSEQIQLLVALTVVAGGVILIAGAIAMGILLWGAFVAQYIEALDLKNECMDLQGTSEDQDVAASGDSVIAPAANETVSFEFEEVELLHGLESELDIVSGARNRSISGRWVRVVETAARSGSVGALESLAKRIVRDGLVEKKQA